MYMIELFLRRAIGSREKEESNEDKKQNWNQLKVVKDCPVTAIFITFYQILSDKQQNPTPLSSDTKAVLPRQCEFEQLWQLK